MGIRGIDFTAIRRFKKTDESSTLAGDLNCRLTRLLNEKYDFPAEILAYV
jgi:hypothetical protein